MSVPELGSDHKEAHRKIVCENKEFLADKLMIEFGVCQGSSLVGFSNLYHTYIPNYNKKLNGFDSFHGLPDFTEKDKNDPWHKGQFDNGGVVPVDLLTDRFTIHQGLFSETLTDEFADSLKGEKIGLLHVDCDIYSSACQVLDFCLKHDLLTKGSIIVYDDWGGYQHTQFSPLEIGEGLAHTEMMAKYSRTCTLKNTYQISSGHEIAVFVLD